jgi:MinD superfamily P-loop ATPase
MRCGVCEFMCPERAIIEARRQAIILTHGSLAAGSKDLRTQPS